MNLYPSFKIIPSLIYRFFLLFVLLLIVSPSSAEENTFPYTLKKSDVFVTPISVACFIGGEYLHARTKFNLDIGEIEQLDRSAINGFDRPATYNWSTKMNTVSDVFAYSMPFLPALVLLPQLQQKQWQNITTVGLMYLQVYTLTRGTTNITKSIVVRTRPYLYNTSYTAAERYDFQGNEAHFASTSFFSGHTAIAFASASFLSKMYTDIYGRGTWSYVIWGASMSAAAFTGYCRIASGEHFPSDVLAGAAVGSAIGFLIPVLHRKKFENISLSVLPDAFHLALNF